MRALDIALIASVLGLAGCYASHRLHEAGDGGAHAPAPSGATSSPPTACLPASTPLFHLGPERGCERRTFEIVAAHRCRHQSDAEASGVPIRIFRERVGRVDVRIHDEECHASARVIDDIDCTWCAAQSVGDFIPRFDDDGVFEMLLFAPDGPRPCTTVDVEVCFDPDYGEPAWDG